MHSRYAVPVMSDVYAENHHLDPDPNLCGEDPCEKCGTPVRGYVEQRCCDGRECACMGLPLVPCWCDACWKTWEDEAKDRAEEFRVQGEGFYESM